MLDDPPPTPDELGYKWYHVVARLQEFTGKNFRIVCNNINATGIDLNPSSISFGLNRDLNLSEPAKVIFKVVLPWYLNGWIVIPCGSVIFGLLILGATGLYVGGMYLNDACDAVWDRKHRPERPIPSGLIAEKTVWSLGIGMMAGGMFFLCLQGSLKDTQEKLKSC